MESHRAPGPGLRLRQAIYFGYHRARGNRVGAAYREILEEDRARAGADHLAERLRELLRHARRAVPYYREHLEGCESEIDADPEAALRRLPVLTKDTIRERFEDLQPSDVAQRTTHEQTSGGSTGEPIRLIQDDHFEARGGAVQLLYSTWAGRRLGEPEVMIWGSERDILQGSKTLRSRIANRLMNRRFVNAFRMTPEAMRDCLDGLSHKPPKLIVAYVQAIDDLAVFAEREGIEVAPQEAIISSAGTLQPQMRERIERVFGCQVLDRYGSREVGDIAGECSHHRGLHVFPWTNYVEILDEEGERVEPGAEGRVIVTSLCNLAMPLIRYEIGDRASALDADQPPCPCGRGGQRIARLLGRTVDTFKTSDGSLVNGEYFTHLLYFKDTVEKFQVVQRSPSSITFRLVAPQRLPSAEAEEIIEGTRALMGPDCEVEFDYVDEIAPSASGKYRYTISEV